MNKNKRRSLLLSSFLLIPILLLIWLGVSFYITEQERISIQIRGKALTRLEQFERSILSEFAAMEAELPVPEDGWVQYATIEDIRELNRENALIRQVFLIGEYGLVFPGPEYEISNLEEEFLQRTMDLQLGPGLFHSSEEEEETNKGWYIWFYAEGSNFMYWKRYEKYIFGIELNRSMVLSRIINSLPSSQGNETFRISLIDVKGNIFYQWGSFTPEVGMQPQGRIALSQQMASWELQYYASPDSREMQSSGIVVLFSTLGLLALVLIFGAVYVYREQTREIRDAEQKVSFVNQVSHELKTPLTNIRMYSELLEEKLTQKGLSRYVSIIVNETLRLSRLIQNVLSFAQAGRNSVQLNRDSLIPDELIKKTIMAFDVQLAQAGIEYELSLNSAEPLLIDGDALEQVLGNLIGNAEKYARLGKYIKIESRVEAGMLRIDVSDRGPGIPPSMQKSVFDAFVRVRDDSTEGVAGTGIGLTISKILVEEMGGTLELRSGKQGSVFAIVIPALDGEYK
jgi:signal transduction histidine kinase